MAKWLLIDGFNLAFRSFYAIPNLTRADGFPTNALHGWVRTLWSLQDKEKPDHTVVFFDLGGSHARLELHPEYKAHRTETPQALRDQFPWIKKITSALGIPVVEKYGVEADDLIASAAIKLQNEGNVAYIVSADKDFGQLLCPSIFQLLPPPTANPKLGWRTLDEAALLEKLFVKPSQIVDYLALIGDASDNIPGIPGVGPKIAARWIAEYGSIENILAKANYISPARFQLVLPQMKDILTMNVSMIKLNTSLEVELNLKESADTNALREIFESMEMKTILSTAQKRFNFQ